MSKFSLIRTIYLYLFALVGLTLLVIGSVMMVNLLMKTLVFKGADPNYVDRPLLVRIAPEKIVSEEDFISAIEKCDEKCELTEEQIVQLDSWLADYDLWQDQQLNNDYRSQSRQREASMALSLILIGLPLYLFHWTLIKRETKKNV